MTNTMAVVMAVSRRVGAVTFSPSERTSRRNLPGLTFAISFCRLKPLAAPRGRTNKPADPHPESETGQRTHFGKPIAAEVQTGRRRAGRFLPPAAVAVKQMGDPFSASRPYDGATRGIRPPQRQRQSVECPLPVFARSGYSGPSAFSRPHRLKLGRMRMAGVEGLEPPTPGFGDRCSSQLSYTPRVTRKEDR